MDSPAARLSHKLSRQAEAVCRHYLPDGRRQGRYWICGDVHGTPGRSLYVRLNGPDRGKGAAGRWTEHVAATSEHGDLLDLIALNLGLTHLRDTLDEARRFLNLPRPDPLNPVTPHPGLARSTVHYPAASGSPEAARRLWAMGRPLAGTPAGRYLANRGLAGLGHTGALRFHPHCYYRREGAEQGCAPETWPALLARVTDNAGRLAGLQRTFLDPHTAGKAPLDPNRKAMGRLLGNAVRIGRPCGVLAVGEGLETMLSLRMALPGLPVAAALSGHHLAAFDPPEGLTRLYIAADADEAGRMAAETLRERSTSGGLETIRLSPVFNDFNDDLRRLGLEEMRDRLRVQLA
ncbi:DUF7146 domain-containing protein [Hoeflea sp.]|uniref:DUF7146 domain-containing protein n=1 Tax=Hoeflea sp. TaxID=1940281 RepID=UPI003B0110A9